MAMTVDVKDICDLPWEKLRYVNDISLKPAKTMSNE